MRRGNSNHHSSQKRSSSSSCCKAAVFLGLIPLLSLAYSSLIVLTLRLQQKDVININGNNNNNNDADQLTSWLSSSSALLMQQGNSKEWSIFQNQQQQKEKSQQSQDPLEQNPSSSSSSAGAGATHSQHSSVNNNRNNPIFAQPTAPWRHSTLLPLWMKEYFQYHQDARRNMTLGLNHWKDYKYLLVRCLGHDEKCGGGADRLKSLPFMIFLAHSLNRRLLLYKWERPVPLEEFLQPPHDGLDWRWPPHPNVTQAEQLQLLRGRPHISNGEQVNRYLGYQPDKDNNKNQDASVAQVDRDDTAQRAARQARLQDQVQKLDQQHPLVVTIRYQSHNHGRLQYDALRRSHEPSYDDVFRQVWTSTFTPVAAIQRQIRQRLAQLQLQPDHFHAIHIRSQYIQNFKQRRIQTHAESTVHCLHQLLRKQQEQGQGQEQSQAHEQSTTITNDNILNQTVFVSSDGHAAAQAAVAYAHERGWHKVTTDVDINNNNMTNGTTLHLHLDRGHHFLSQRPKEWTQHEAPHYYDTFVDLYVLAQAKCIVFGLGNYGRWANLMSTDVKCHLDMRVERTCEWPRRT